MSEPRILALATAVPPHRLRQDEARALAPELFAGPPETIARLLPVFDNAGIATRHSCLPLERFREPPRAVERNHLYLEHGVALLEEVARQCLAKAGLTADSIDSIVTVSTTGIATPSFDARLVDRLGLRRNVERLPIFGLGCAGGVLGLARAASLARAAPGSRVLLLVVELCALCFRRDDASSSAVVASAIFADGAAGIILSDQGEGPRLGPAGEHTWPDSLDVMGWAVEEDGWRAIFSRDIPTLVRNELRPVTEDFLTRHGLDLADIGAFVCHPGGAKVVAALEHAFGLLPGSLIEARSVLRDYGNMSAASVFFVLERVLRRGLRRRMLLSALGPGFTAAFQLLDAR
jgi:alkylresorcinol/alkylpyrone synthase